mmetsp:Transcript_15806/g.60187  ORF Transcript_15806/g.60187 Transcript_15806/m.60187 type:complete len:210 (-) Transcript_15806:446-1075(-)
MRHDGSRVTPHELHKPDQAEVLEVLVGIFDEALQDAGAEVDHPRHGLGIRSVIAPRVRECEGKRVDALVLEALRMRVRRDGGERVQQLSRQSWLLGDQGPEQLDNLYQHPVVAGAVHQLEELRRHRQVVLRILLRQLTDHVDGGGDDGGLVVLQAVCQLVEGQSEALGELDIQLEERKRGLLPHICAGVVGQRDHVAEEVPRQLLVDHV